MKNGKNKRRRICVWCKVSKQCLIEEKKREEKKTKMKREGREINPCAFHIVFSLVFDCPLTILFGLFLPRTHYLSVAQFMFCCGLCPTSNIGFDRKKKNVLRLWWWNGHFITHNTRSNIEQYFGWATPDNNIDMKTIWEYNVNSLNVIWCKKMLINLSILHTSCHLLIYDVKITFCSQSFST